MSLSQLPGTVLVKGSAVEGLRCKGTGCFKTTST